MFAGYCDIWGSGMDGVDVGIVCWENVGYVSKLRHVKIGIICRKSEVANFTRNHQNVGNVRNVKTSEMYKKKQYKIEDPPITMTTNL